MRKMTSRDKAMRMSCLRTPSARSGSHPRPRHTRVRVRLGDNKKNHDAYPLCSLMGSDEQLNHPGKCSVLSQGSVVCRAESQIPGEK